jgi:hypothetical protein
MARASYPRHTGPPPPALPPEAQTVGQLVAETIRLYGQRFLVALPLGLPLAVADQLSLEHSRSGRVAVLMIAAPAFTCAYVAACALVLRTVPSSRVAAGALVSGTIAFLPAAFFSPWFALLSVAWLALAGHVVPAAIAESLGPMAASRRSFQLARADYVHAAGGLATLVILFGLTRVVMGQLLRSQADNTLRVAVFLADVVLSPMLFLGGALLYVNLAARVGLDREQRRRARAEAIGRLRARPPAD